ncbi:hypothetical protein BVG91_02390 [Serratia marcescens]|nr:hypothetical protein BVG91_02390 [Serratia marcescens]
MRHCALLIALAGRVDFRLRKAFGALAPAVDHGVRLRVLRRVNRGALACESMPVPACAAPVRLGKAATRAAVTVFCIAGIPGSDLVIG